MARLTPRFLSRTAAACLVLAGGLAFSACTDGSPDGPAGPDVRPGSFEVLPRLSFEGAGLDDATDEGLTSAWRQRDRWHVLAIANPDGRTAADDTIAVSPGSDVDTLQVVITTRAGDESYDLHFTALAANGRSLFTVVVEDVVPPRDGNGEPLEVEGTLKYVGPGADASAVLASADTLRLLAGTTGAVSAQVLDDQESPVEGVPLGWSSEDPGVASVQGEGSAAAVRGVTEGVTRVVVSTPTGLQDETVVIVTQLQVSPPAAEVPLGGLQAFQAPNAPDGSALVWSVNGVEGGSDSFGTISAEGLYEAPVSIPEPATFPVCARLAEAPDARGCAEVTIVVDPLRIFPEHIERLPGGTLQFTVENAPDGATFEWSVNGTVGGDDTFGTITSDGFYRAPEEVPDPEEFPVCVQLEGAPSTETCATVLIRPIPTAGEDLVVINDMNIFDNNAMTQGVGDPNNHVMVRNLIGFGGDRIRSDETVILWDRGRNSPCWAGGNGECADAGMATTRSVIEEAGYTIRAIESTEGSLTSIDPDVKMIWLWNPRVVFTVEEVNTLKRFAAEGGRILIVGEHAGFFGPAGIQTENQLLADMGAEMVNIGQAVECGFQDLPESVLREHQITEGMTAVRLACASVIEPGPNDFVLFTDRNQTNVLAGVAKIDVVPIDEHAEIPALVETTVTPNATGAGVELSGGR